MRIFQYFRRRRVASKIDSTLDGSLKDYSTLDPKIMKAGIKHHSVKSTGGVYEITLQVKKPSIAIGSRGSRVRKLSSYLSKFYGEDIRVTVQGDENR